MKFLLLLLFTFSAYAAKIPHNQIVPYALSDITGAEAAIAEKVSKSGDEMTGALVVPYINSTSEVLLDVENRVIYTTGGAPAIYLDEPEGAKVGSPAEGDSTDLISSTYYVMRAIGTLQSYVNTGLATKQNSLGYTAENTANKSTSVVTDQASSTKYPTVKSLYDWATATFQTPLGFTPEDIANKSTSTSLGVSNTLYPSQNAVKTYVDAGLALKQDIIADFTFSKNTAAPNSTVPVISATVTSSETDIDMAMTPKNAGAFILGPYSDNGTTGGNKRGANAIDLQLGTRTLATQVASGANAMAFGWKNISSATSSIAIGTSNSVSNTNGIAIGNSNSVQSTTGAIAIGSTNTSTGSVSVALGNSNTADSAGSLSTGTNAHSRAMNGRMVHSSSAFAAAGDSQFSHIPFKVATTNATPAVMTTTGLGAAATTRITLQNESAYAFSGFIVAKQQTSTNISMWKVEGLIVRGAAAANTTLVTSSVTAVSNVPAFTAPAISADTTNGCLTFTVTGVAATNIRWNGRIDTVEVTYP